MDCRFYSIIRSSAIKIGNLKSSSSITFLIELTNLNASSVVNHHAKIVFCLGIAICKKSSSNTMLFYNPFANTLENLSDIHPLLKFSCLINKKLEKRQIFESSASSNSYFPIDYIQGVHGVVRSRIACATLFRQMMMEA